MAQDYKETINRLVADEDTFLRLTLKAPAHAQDNMPWRRVVVRPVLIKNTRYLQFSYFDDKQDITKNYHGLEAQVKLDVLLALQFSSISIKSTLEDVHLQITKGGKALFSHSKPTGNKKELNLAHDMSKDLPLPAGRPNAFLQSLGIMNKQGQVIPAMQDKFSQINEFLKLFEHTGELEHFEKMPVNILDCGCGSAYLSFATYHYLNEVRGIPANLIGIDTNGRLVEKSDKRSEELGFDKLGFQKSAIIDYIPEMPPDIILALHACDTATDEALVQGILWNARLMLCVPCCHHELHRQLQVAAPFKPVLQHGILKKRMADILTDSFRALVLRMMGYKTDVVEFVSSEHTDRNLMIRAVKRTKAGDNKCLREYNDLKSFWGVTPFIEKLLRAKQCWPEE